MERFATLLFALVFIAACSSRGSEGGEESSKADKYKVETKPTDDGKGIGEVTYVELNSPLDAQMVEHGKSIYELKCAACHKLDDQRVVGPGWKGLTEIRKPEWLMNMITNVDIMLAEDPTAQELLKECLVRMPNQNMTIEDARDIVEFMYANDGQEIGS